MVYDMWDATDLESFLEGVAMIAEEGDWTPGEDLNLEVMNAGIPPAFTFGGVDYRLADAATANKWIGSQAVKIFTATFATGAATVASGTAAALVAAIEEETQTSEEDNGIGAYEFWGQRGTDQRWGIVAEDCTLKDPPWIALECDVDLGRDEFDGAFKARLLSVTVNEGAVTAQYDMCPR